MSDFTVFVGIDPGATGGVAILDANGAILRLAPFKGEVFSGLEVVASYLGARVMLEKVNAMPGQGVVSMFSFGMGYGMIQGWLIARGIGFVQYSPQAWQKGLPRAGTAKGRAVAHAKDTWGLEPFIFERCRVPHQGCLDAACMADFIRKIELGQIERPIAKPAKPKRQPIRI